MLSGFRKTLIAGVVALGALVTGLPAVHAADVQQVGREAYLKNLKGKKVIFVPISQGFDLNQAWVTVWQRHA